MTSLAYKVAARIKHANPEGTSSVEVMQYALGIIFNTLFILLATAIIGIVTGHFVEFMTFLLSFSILRLASGGFHLRTAFACNIVSVLLSTLIPFLFNVSGQPLLIINGIGLFIMILFAPNPDKNAQIPRKLYPTLKIISILLVASNFFILSSVIGLAFLVQSLTVIPWERRGKE